VVCVEGAWKVGHKGGGEWRGRTEWKMSAGTGHGWGQARGQLVAALEQASTPCGHAPPPGQVANPPSSRTPRTTSQASARKNVPTSTGVCSLVTLTSNGRLKVYANRGFTIFWAPSPVSIFMAESRVDPRDRATFVKTVCILPVRFWV
jgi:hypothetical protein